MQEFVGDPDDVNTLYAVALASCSCAGVSSLLKHVGEQEGICRS